MSKETAIFLLKPDSRRRTIANYPLPEIIKGLLTSSGLTIVDRSSKQLDDQRIRKLYPILNVPDPKYGEEWKGLLIRHIASEPVESLLLEGEDANKKAKIIKNYLRMTLCDQSTEKGKVIENIAHVPDEVDFTVSKDILFSK